MLADEADQHAWPAQIRANELPPYTGFGWSVNHRTDVMPLNKGAFFNLRYHNGGTILKDVMPCASTVGFKRNEDAKSQDDYWHDYAEMYDPIRVIKGISIAKEPLIGLEGTATMNELFKPYSYAARFMTTVTEPKYGSCEYERGIPPWVIAHCEMALMAPTMFGARTHAHMYSDVTLVSIHQSANVGEITIPEEYTLYYHDTSDQNAASYTEFQTAKRQLAALDTASSSNPITEDLEELLRFIWYFAKAKSHDVIFTPYLEKLMNPPSEWGTSGYFKYTELQQLLDASKAGRSIIPMVFNNRQQYATILKDIGIGVLSLRAIATTFKSQMVPFLNGVTSTVERSQDSDDGGLAYAAVFLYCVRKDDPTKSVLLVISKTPEDGRAAYENVRYYRYVVDKGDVAGSPPQVVARDAAVSNTAMEQFEIYRTQYKRLERMYKDTDNTPDQFTL